MKRSHWLVGSALTLALASLRVGLRRAGAARTGRRQRRRVPSTAVATTPQCIQRTLRARADPGVPPGASRIRLQLGRRLLGLDRLRLDLEQRLLGA